MLFITRLEVEKMPVDFLFRGLVKVADPLSYSF